VLQPGSIPMVKNLKNNKYQTAIVTNSQTVKEIQMNKTLMSIVLLLGFAVLVGLSVASYAAESVGNVVDDTIITTTVKAELAKDVRLGTLTDIEVSATQGVVTLAGKVHNSEEKAMVEQKVRGVTGVVKVNNELQIQKG
jgi:osmotically-inducible protein OsmY